MKITVVGATGGIGGHLLDQAGAEGYDVTALVRDPAKVRGHRAVVADLELAAPEELVTAVEGADAVLSALGPRRPSAAGVCSQGTRSLAAAMVASGVRRIVVVSAAPVGTVAVPGRAAPARHDPGDGFFMRHLLAPLTKALLAGAYADLALMEEELRQSGLDWTVVRPPRLVDGPATGTYRVAYDRNLRRGLTVRRGDVAHLMLELLERPETIGHTVGVAN